MTTMKSLSLIVLFGTVLCSPLLHAQSALTDNSFLLEEAYNQEAGVVQHVGKFSRDSGDAWEIEVSEEWPAPSIRHQLSWALPYGSSGGHSGFGDPSVGYRYQLLGAAGGDVALAPSIVMTIPRGGSEVSSEFSLTIPISYRWNDRFTTHTNVGIGRSKLDGASAENSIFLGQSLVWMARPEWNLLVESTWEQGADDDVLLLSPGFRFLAHEGKSGLAIVPGIAVPFEIGGESSRSVLLYLSFEHPFLAGR